MKKLIVAVLCLFFVTSFVGCQGNKPQPADYDISKFYIKTVDYQLSDEYIVCYGNDDHEIVNMGAIEQPLIIAENRIFFTNGTSLVSVDFKGEDEKTLGPKDGEDIEFGRIASTDGTWLYCSGQKMVEIYNDPVAVDGFHYVPAQYKVKADFSEYSEIE